MPAAFVAGILHYRYETLHCQQLEKRVLSRRGEGAALGGTRGV